MPGITLATTDLESRIDFSLGLLRQANSCGEQKKIKTFTELLGTIKKGESYDVKRNIKKSKRNVRN